MRQHSEHGRRRWTTCFDENDGDDGELQSEQLGFAADWGETMAERVDECVGVADMKRTVAVRLGLVERVSVQIGVRTRVVVYWGMTTRMMSASATQKMPVDAVERRAVVVVQLLARGRVKQTLKQARTRRRLSGCCGCDCRGDCRCRSQCSLEKMMKKQHEKQCHRLGGFREFLQW